MVKLVYFVQKDVTNNILSVTNTKDPNARYVFVTASGLFVRG